ncbi:anhydro-N-acetylmuramic acid kinase [Bacteroidota bacterium]
MLNKNKYTVIGVMSGTSLDGLDIACCQFELKDQHWTYSIIEALTFPYDYVWTHRLEQAQSLSALDMVQLDKNLGAYIGNKVRKFIEKYQLQVDFIASHGHTIFHQPEKGITLQVGSGEMIASECRMTTVFDFRSLDVALGGQGAPLVPVGDELLFSGYTYCLNLGGFSNISYRENSKRLAYDICPVNSVLNRLCPPFDKGGETGRMGNVHQNLLYALNSIAFYSLPPPKSLGKEWLDQEFMTIIKSYDCSTEDKIRTVYEHIAMKISRAINPSKNKSDMPKVLLSGGGTYNDFLIELISEKSEAEFVIPSPELVEFKEALVFAFLGVLRMRGEINCLASVTGARQDSCGGVVIDYRI